MPTSATTAVNLGDRFDPHQTIRFPGLAPQDILVWQSAQQLLAPRYADIYYNVRVGAYNADFASLPAQYQRQALDASAFRIDAVGDTGERWELIEVKDRSSLGALGQLLGYAVLWHLAPPDDRPIHLIYVTPQLTFAVGTVMQKYGVESIVAPT